MKHGKTAKKTAKTLSKASKKKSSSTKAVPSKGKASRNQAGPKAAGKAKSNAKTTAHPGKAVAVKPAGISFSNPAIATAYQRAVKKYPTAFRKLTD